MTTKDVTYDITPYNGTPGKEWDLFEERLLNYGARSDERGWSLADNFNGVDEGTAAVP